MPAGKSRGPLDRLINTCLTLLIAATAIYVAVRLIEAVWTALLVILAVGAFTATVVAVLRMRGQGW